MIRKFIPKKIKRTIRLWQRARIDKKTGITGLFAEESTDDFTKPIHTIVRIAQPIFYNPLSANKVTNIRIAINHLERVQLEPNQILSFWHIIGNPTEEKGYKVGRNIIGNQLQEDIGGGLCQVSGMLYHLALLGGLHIEERHCHTLDLYEEDKRYTPLGADATVVYGFKDLRIKNPHPSPVTFVFDVSETEFIGQLKCNEVYPASTIRFERKDSTTKREIKTYRIQNSKEEFINLSVYRLEKK